MTPVQAICPEDVFERLESFSKSDVELINWYSRAFGTATNWRSWVKQVFGELLEAPAGAVIHLAKASQLSQDKNNYRFEKREILIGRGSENDIVLDLAVVSRRHARLIRIDGKVHLEDLDSSTGTYLNEKRLSPNNPEAIYDGDRILIFPYVLEYRLEEIWRAHEPPELWAGPPRATSWGRFQRALPAECYRFYFTAHPNAGELLMAGDRTFLEAVVARVTRMPVQPLVPSDSAVFQVFTASVLRRANSEVAFPLQFLLQEDASTIEETERGLCVDFSVGLPGLVGAFKLFLPEPTLTKMQSLVKLPSSSVAYDAIETVIQVSVSHMDLNALELCELEIGDLLLFESSPTLTLLYHCAQPGLERGWIAKQVSHDPLQIEIQDPFERKLFMEEQSEGRPITEGGKPDLKSLPVRLHAVLTQVEMTLARLESLAPGSILELNWGKTEPLQLAVNGKVIGSGRLVDIEGKLGVQITSWSNS